ncbi:AMP-binding protein [Pseudonocardia sp. K10HN5]|uniref:AMP-binding protein n=1 Tax=Pseudonocardia acidicola TaxID=2724939 RepID=A0ABX1S9T5_9PSEU|nr:AMP-binding protein [Pseudonocardia acidicola]
MPFVHQLQAYGDRPAVVAPDGTEISYRQLAARVSDVADRLGSVRRLVLIAASNDVEPLVTYLAALQGGHPVLLASADDRHHRDALVAAYDPDVVLSPTAGGWQLHERRPGSAHTLHPELALLLSTSGSTGSPKLVRLSAANVQANAASIAQYLGIRDTDRAVVSLPLHYCYGLSVVNSNLLCGAALILSKHSVVDPCFWSAFREHRATSLHGVPHTFDLLDRIGFDRLELPSLRYVTQAGGRLPAHQVRRFAELGERTGWDLFVMYGQTEATARMAYLPPGLTASHPSAIGVPVPGGSFELVSTGRADEGELVYSGPNVMLGYAHGPADLALGRTVDVLATGDIARRTPDGLYEVIGRKSRFVKLLGLRIDLDRVERILADAGITAACTGTDDGLIVAVTGADAGHVLRTVSARLGLPVGCIRTITVDELPRLGNGKIDYRTLGERARADAGSFAGTTRGPVRALGRLRRARERSVRAVFVRVLGEPDVDGDASFVSLGGDSLSYVEMSVALEDVLGCLPEDWHVLTVTELERARRRRRFGRAMETAVALRAVSIVLVVASHVGALHVLGGAHLLLALSGYSFARFTLVPVAGWGFPRRIGRSLARIAVPTVLWISWLAATEDHVRLRNIALLNAYLDPGFWNYWFVESLVQILALAALLFSVPAVRRFEHAHPFGFALTVLAVALVARGYGGPGNEFSALFMSLHLVLWIFALGWLAGRSRTAAQRAVVGALVLVLLPGFFGDPVREAIVAGGLLLVLLRPRIVLPRPAPRVLALLAGASLSIYLTHYAVYPELLPHVPPAVVVVLSLAAGIGGWLIVRWAARVAAAVLGRRGRPRPLSGAEPVGPFRAAPARAL